MVYRKKLIIEKNSFSVGSVKIIELLYMLYTHGVWVNEITGIMISIKKINKN